MNEEKIKFAAVSFAAGLFVAFVIGKIPGAMDLYRARAPLRAAAHEADRIGLTYEDVLKNAAANAGKPVHWDVSHPAADKWYYHGDSGKPVFWDGPAPEDTITGQSGQAHGVAIVGTVANFSLKAVLLRAVPLAQTNPTVKAP